MNTEEEKFYSEAFARNLGLISAEDQKKLKNARVAIGGIGAAGGIYVTTMARLGVGAINIADQDTFDIVNMNRQAGSYVSTRGQAKVVVMEKMAKDINPYMDVRTFPNGITPENIHDFLKDVDVVLDGIDFFNFEARHMMYRTAAEMGIPVVGSGPIGFGSSMITFAPGSMKFDNYFGFNDSQSQEEKLLRFGIGLTPSLIQRSYYPMNIVKFKEKSASSSIISIVLVANLSGTQTFKIITGKPFMKAPYTMHFDPYVQKLRITNLRWGNKGLLQRLKIWYAKRMLSIK